MRNFTETNLTEAVLAKLESAPSPRFRQVMSSVITHLHACIREVELTEAEWFAAIQFLTTVGKKCDDKRQEFILLSDTLGASMLVDTINHRTPAGATESTVLGPFHVPGAPELANGANVAAGFPGEPALFSGRVLTMEGKPIAGAQLDVWQADAEGLYDVQRANLNGKQLRGKVHTNEHGKFWFWTVRPTAYPVPTDGPVGQMLLNMGRHPYRPAHIHAMITASGYAPLTTHVFAEGDQYLDSDAVFGVKDSLIVKFVRHDPGTASDGTVMKQSYFTVAYDFGLAAA